MTGILPTDRSKRSKLIAEFPKRQYTLNAGLGISEVPTNLQYLQNQTINKSNLINNIHTHIRCMGVGPEHQKIHQIRGS